VNASQRNYSQVKGELLAVCKNLKAFRHYIYGRHFILKIDSSGLLGMLNAFSVTDATISRWLGYIHLFNFTAERVSTKENKIADIFSRAHSVEDNSKYPGKQQLNDLAEEEFDVYMFSYQVDIQMKMQYSFMKMNMKESG
jgi:hypothetical protein